MPVEESESHVEKPGQYRNPGSLEVEIAAPAIFVG
jgi:hypothetical protein